jgi:hypothetical protein
MWSCGRRKDGDAKRTTQARALWFVRCLVVVISTKLILSLLDRRSGKAEQDNRRMKIWAARKEHVEVGMFEQQTNLCVRTRVAVVQRIQELSNAFQIRFMLFK